MWKKILFALIPLTIFFGLIEIVLRILNVETPAAPVVIERIMNTDMRYDWLQEDPLLFWRLAGDDPNRINFRIEALSDAQNHQICAEYQQPIQLIQKSETTDATGSAAFESFHAADKAHDDDKDPADTGTGVIPQKKQMPRLSANFEGYTLKPLDIKPDPGIQCIICLGDSCTFFGHPSYPKRLEVLLNCDRETAAWQVINAGVPAYSSYQGRKLFEDRLAEFHPDIVTVYFGWNDHWLARDTADKEQERTGSPASGSACIQSALKSVRIDDGLRSIIRTFSSRMKSNRSKPSVFRVSKSDYKDNLTRIADIAARRGCKAVFLTAPQGFDPQHLPEYLRDMQYFNDLTTLIQTHSDYNDIVRSVALETDSLLIDLSYDLESLPGRKELFLNDGIHLTATGIQEMSNIIYRKLLASVNGSKDGGGDQ